MTFHSSLIGMDRKIGSATNFKCHENRAFRWSALSKIHVWGYKQKFPIVGVVGNFHGHSFSNIVKSLHANVKATYYEEMSQIVGDIDLMRNFDLILFLETFHGEFPLHKINLLQAKQPLTRFVMMGDTLAEGERRTGSISSGLFRYYIHQWDRFVVDEFVAFCKRQPSAWDCPRTATDEECSLFKITRRLRRKSTHFPDFPQAQTTDLHVANGTRHALVIAEDVEMRRFLFDYLQTRYMQSDDWQIKTGYHSVETSAHVEMASMGNPMTDVFYDVIRENFADVVSEIGRIRSAMGRQCLLTVFYNAPRFDEKKQMTDLGVNHLISKPFFFC